MKIADVDVVGDVLGPLVPNQQPPIAVDEQVPDKVLLGVARPEGGVEADHVAVGTANRGAVRLGAPEAPHQLVVVADVVGLQDVPDLAELPEVPPPYRGRSLRPAHADPAVGVVLEHVLTGQGVAPDQ